MQLFDGLISGVRWIGVGIVSHDLCLWAVGFSDRVENQCGTSGDQRNPDDNSFCGQDVLLDDKTRICFKTSRCT